MPLADITPYRKYVDHYNLTEEQKAELIHAVWNIMEIFADQAFGDDPVQQAIEANASKSLQKPKAKLYSITGHKIPGASKLRK